MSISKDTENMTRQENTSATDEANILQLTETSNNSNGSPDEDVTRPPRNTSNVSLQYHNHQKRSSLPNAKPKFTAEQLADWDFNKQCNEDSNCNEQRFIQVPKRNKFLYNLNEKYDIEHRGRLYYYFWHLLVSAANILCCVLLDLRANEGKQLFTLAAANLFVCIFSRTVWFKWLVYLPTVLTKNLPTGICKAFINKAVVNHGGVHTCTALWLVLSWSGIIVVGISNGAGGSPRDTAHFFIASITLIILLIVVAFALPYRHHKVYHDIFELTHRFGGWLIAGLFVIDVSLSLSSSGDDMYSLMMDPSLWLVVGSIVLVVYPWLGILKVYNKAVHICIPSDWVAIVSWSPKPWFSVPGTAGQLAFEHHGAREYHHFALLNDINGDPEKATMAVAKAGDWTTMLIDAGKEAEAAKKCGDVEFGGVYDNSETNFQLCLGRVAAPGFMYLVRSYKRVVCIGTGAGIAPIASFLPNPPNEMMILWVGRKFKETYGPITDLVTSHEHSILIDTKAPPSDSNPYTPAYRASLKHGEGTMELEENCVDAERPDLPQLALAAVELFRADAVFIVSGPKPTYDVCHQLWKAGIHAYGATWDS